MLFNSLIFPVFFLIVIVVYYRLNLDWQNKWLLLASYFFYGWWDWRFCSLLIFSTGLDWIVSHALHKSNEESLRKQYLGLSIVGNLGVLAFFKYFNFFAGSLESLLISIGFQPDMFTLNLILPMGISFYTFQTMSYTIDVYRKRQVPSENFIGFALYVSFFPQLVAGPIERAKRLLPQIMKHRTYLGANIRAGVPLILFGYFKKIVIADSLAPIVESCFRDPTSMSGVDLLLGVYAFAIQIYCDFSGYTDIARGIAKTLGFDLIPNFTAPYFSRNITEFWRRWHISLSSWLKDYLYISIGGNRKGKLRTYVNLMLTMLLGGLWHGAAWTFVIWGGIHGLYLSFHKMIQNSAKLVAANERTGLKQGLVNAGKIVLTFHLVGFTWIFFRSDSLSAALHYLQGIFSNAGSSTIAQPVLLAMIVTSIVDVGQRKSNEYTWLNHLPSYWRYALSGSLLLASLLVFGYHYSSPTPFIYFQF